MPVFVSRPEPYVNMDEHEQQQQWNWPKDIR